MQVYTQNTMLYAKETWLCLTHDSKFKVFLWKEVAVRNKSNQATTKFAAIKTITTTTKDAGAADKGTHELFSYYNNKLSPCSNKPSIP